MMDLTKITTPFGLLDEETQAAMKAHGGPYEMSAWHDYAWREVQKPTWLATLIYRVKAQPPKPRERWVPEGLLWDNYADAYNACERGEKPVRVREVTDE